MLRLIKKIFNIKDLTYYHKILEEGAMLIDVRSKEEFEDSHVKGSLNIPIEQLTASLPILDKQKVIIFVCQDKVRSKVAAYMLKKNGFTKVYDGGSWVNFVKRVEPLIHDI